MSKHDSELGLLRVWVVEGDTYLSTCPISQSTKLVSMPFFLWHLLHVKSQAEIRLSTLPCKAEQACTEAERQCRYQHPRRGAIVGRAKVLTVKLPPYFTDGAIKNPIGHFAQTGLSMH